ncbi:hypothetical protein EPA93_25990 [Ktedonosporobacter rubrisoli]|uniref:VCBS repeat-containing protein n=1 Tax=Ktedonosporobacter rubrisoli TaxID=2509675 RepID=A0A4P6JUE2_KTERU|nr:VCBS repeat-containing protein [Ktedonosporobacter rubrisoli]QBD79247.1 hypothetical protein EPA93_25990 [Ktedonosporobacter rubrisoli]
MGQNSIRRSPQASLKQQHSSDIFDAEFDDMWPARMPSSTRRYRGDVKTEVGRSRPDVQPLTLSDTRSLPTRRKNAIPPRRTASIAKNQARKPQPVDTEEIFPKLNLRSLKNRSPRFHWLFYCGMALLVMMLGWVVLSMVTNWWQVTQDDWHYGRPRTFQTDAVVGHADSAQNPSHFIAINLNRHVEVIEFPGGDASKAKIYLGPVLLGQNQDLTVVTLSFKDVNGDGKPDMIVNVQDSRFIFINDNGAFRPERSGENLQI